MAEALLILAVFVLAGTVKGVIGLGLPTVALGLLTASIGLEAAMALMLAPSCVTNLWQALVGGHGVAVVRRTWPFLLLATLAVWPGVALSGGWDSAPKNAYRVAGIGRADSVALDPHKWLHAPFEAGCVLIQDSSAHHGAFAVTPEYLESAPRGLAAAPWLHELGLQTTRGFKALKVWMALKEHGAEKFGRLIDQNIAQAHYLTALVEAEPELELVAPTNINIVCYRYRPHGIEGESLKELNTEIMLRLQEQGTAALSDTTVRSEHCLRVAIANHRTRRDDLELLIRETAHLGRSVAKGIL